MTRVAPRLLAAIVIAASLAPGGFSAEPDAAPADA